jgi:plastocyanin
VHFCAAVRVRTLDSMKTIYATAFGISTFFALNCGSGDGYGEGSSAPAEATTQSTAAEPAAKVVVEGHAFDPQEVHIKVGQTVRWVWVAGSHDVVSGSACTPDGNFTSGGDTQGPGSQFDHVFEKAGSFSYYCDPHCGIGMTGTIVVE